VPVSCALHQALNMVREMHECTHGLEKLTHTHTHGQPIPMLWVLWVHTHQGYIHTTGNDGPHDGNDGDNSDNATYLYLCNDDDRDDGSSRPMSASA